MNGSSLVACSGEGRQFSIGNTKFAVRASSLELGEAFGLLEFSGPEGAWTVPHVHQHGRESFYILEGEFTFRLGDEERKVGPGDFVSVAPRTVHMMRAEAGGGRFLALVPNGLEAMFVEMSELGPEALTDPAIRKDLASRHDSLPA